MPLVDGYLACLVIRVDNFFLRNAEKYFTMVNLLIKTSVIKVTHWLYIPSDISRYQHGKVKVTSSTIALNTFFTLYNTCIFFRDVSIETFLFLEI